MKRHGLLWKSSLTVAGVATLTVGTVSVATATPPSTPPPSASAQVIGVLAEGHKAKSDGIELKTKGDVAVLDFELTYGPGAYSGWHAHPGIVIATVKSGSVTRQLGCGPVETFEVGDTFTEVGAHFVSNPGPVSAVLSITQIVPADRVAAPLRRIDLPAPTC